MVLPREKVQNLYQSGAKYYDFAVQVLYRLIGFRIARYRTHAIELLHLKQGDCIVELGCGTGLNFPLLIEQIGPEGKLIGVDFASEMLMYAHKKIKHFGWKNVELVQADISAYKLPKNINGVLATGVFGYIADYDRVIKTISEALAPGGRLVILDGKRSDHIPSWLLKLFVHLGSPFGLTLDYFKNRSWKSVERYFQEVTFEELYGGLAYISSGTVPKIKQENINSAIKE